MPNAKRNVRSNDNANQQKPLDDRNRACHPLKPTCEKTNRNGKDERYGQDRYHPIAVPEKPALEGLEQKWSARWEADGVYRFDRLSPGSYNVIAWNEGISSDPRPALVPDGGAAELDFALR